MKCTLAAIMACFQLLSVLSGCGEAPAPAPEEIPAPPSSSPTETLPPEPSPTPEPEVPASKKTVVIDAGHQARPTPTRSLWGRGPLKPR